MDEKRAKEIASSPFMANVTYNGTRIYIEKINENTGTASIHNLSQPDCKQEAPISNLIEH
jgi:small acid-soluble spore protein H (minor)